MIVEDTKRTMRTTILYDDGLFAIELVDGRQVELFAFRHNIRDRGSWVMIEELPDDAPAVAREIAESYSREDAS